MIFGLRTEDQLRRNLGAAELILSEDERGRLDKVSLQRLLYPHWHQRDRAAARLGAPELSLIRPHLKKAIKAALRERQLQRNSNRKTICGSSAPVTKATPRRSPSADHNVAI